MQCITVILLALAIAATASAHGWDKSSCSCDDECLHPQCCSDGQTYLSPCYVKCRNDFMKKTYGKTIQVMHYGNCDVDLQSDLLQPKKFKYCGKSDLVQTPAVEVIEVLEPMTISDSSVLKSELLLPEAPITNIVEIWDEGLCLCDKNDNRPQCASDWETYANPCFVDCRNDYLKRTSGLPIYITYAGRCHEPLIKAADINNDGCDHSEHLIKILGEDDGSYHPSADEYESERKNDDIITILTPITLKAEILTVPMTAAEASTTQTAITDESTTKAVEIYDESNCKCDKDDIRPQCASDWLTYINPCFVECRNDYLRKISGMPIFITYPGKCYEPLTRVEDVHDLLIITTGEDDGSYHPSADEYESEHSKDLAPVTLKPLAPLTQITITELPTTLETYDESNCKCDKYDIRPQCASDWLTYTNPCFVECRNDYLRKTSAMPIFITYAGKCYEPITEATPEDEYDYLPKIAVKEDNIHHLYAIEIYDESRCMCDKYDIRPQCASDGLTYLSTCYVNCRNEYLKRISAMPIFITHAGKCSKPVTQVLATRDDELIHTEYLPRLALKSDSSHHLYAFETYDESRCLCDKYDIRPQCASDGQTYLNTCFVNCRNEYLKRVSGIPIFITHVGKCKEAIIEVAATHDDELLQTEHLPKIELKDDGSHHVYAVEIFDDSQCLCDKYDIRPQCASDWETYLNPCFVDCRNDYLKKTSGLPIYITYAGKCNEPIIKDSGCNH